MYGRPQNRLRHKNCLLRGIAVLLCLVSVFSVTVPAWGFTLNHNRSLEPELPGLVISDPVAGGAALDAENSLAAKDGTAAAGTVPYATAFGKIADPDTSQAFFAADTRENGRLWTDKTVNARRAVIYDGSGKPVGGVDAAADEFLVTLSAMSQSYQETTTVAEPSDTVFVIDVSASMYQNKLENGDSRVKVMVEALNEAITMLMDGHPENRVAVVAFGGLPVQNKDSQSRICEILKLGRYEGIPNDAYFRLDSPAYIQVSDSIRDDQLIDPASRRIRVYGGTSTQHGIYAGAQILLNNPKEETIYQVDSENTVVRKPNLILLTDGEPTMGWTDYRFADPISDTPNGFDSGDANTVDMGLDLLTVLSASYFKEKVHDYYYGVEDGTRSAGFYSIGLDVADSEDARAIMDPLGTTGGQINAAAVSQSNSGKIYNMKTALDDFVAGGRTVFPTLVKNSGKHRLVTIDNVGNEVQSYDFADLFVTPTTVEQLKEAFRSVARQIISSASYPTKVDPAQTDYGGFVIFSDVLGRYMEFRNPRGLWFNNSQYTGSRFAQNVTQGSDGGETKKKFTESAFVRNALFGAAGAGSITDQQAEETIAALLESAVAAGAAGDRGVYYRNGDFGNRLTYYADEKCVWMGNYYQADGSAAAPIAGASCIIDLYPVSAETQNTTNGEDSNLVYATFKVITALEKGDFREWNSDGTELVRHLEAEQQMVRWYIPASLLPMRSVTPSYDVTHHVTGIHVTNTVPIRFIYSVGLKKDLLPADVAQEYKDRNSSNGNAYYFYTNDWQDSQNPAMATFIPNNTNPYYYYTAAEADESGHIPLYTKTGSGYQAVTGGYQAGTDYYTRSGYYTAAAGSRELEAYRPVADPGIIVQDSIPYITVGAVKKAAISAASEEVLQGKQDNPTGTNGNAAEMTGFDLGQGLIRQRLLGNNGRLTVPVTKLTVTKEWDARMNVDPAAGLIKAEYLQLYGGGTAMGAPKLAEPPETNPDPEDGPNPAVDVEWTELPVYRTEADQSGNTAPIEYTVAEGTWNGTVFTPYKNSQAPFFISYSQPVWDPETGKQQDAKVNNYKIFEYQRYLVLNKLFEGLDPAQVFQTGRKTIDFDLYISAPGSGKYWYLGTMTYPDGFTGGQTAAEIVGDSTSPPEFQGEKVDFLLVEKNHQVDGYRWELSGEGAGVSPVLRPEELEVVYPGAAGNLHEITAADYAFEIPGVANRETVSLKLTNRYQPVSQSFTLTKAYTGDIKTGIREEIPDITFIVQAWETEADWAAGEEPVFSDTTGSGLLKANGGSVTFPIDQQMEDLYAGVQGYEPIAHPQELPEGYYRITEVNADGFEQEGYLYDAVLSVTTDSPGVTVDSDGTAKSAGFFLTGGTQVKINMTNDYRVRPRLIIEKRFAGDVQTPVPAEIAEELYFTVTEQRSGKVIRTIPYEEFTGGQYILNDLPAGTYAVAEIGSQSVPGYEPVVTTVESANGKTGTVSLTAGDEKVIFTNTYTKIPGTLTIRKELTGSYGDWGVGDTTVFRVRVQDVTAADPARHAYLILDQNNALTGTSATGGTVLEVSRSNPVLVQRLPAGHKYRVEEVKPEGAVYTVTYENEKNEKVDFITMETGNQAVTVVNDYPRETGSLIITKELTGAYEDWGITAAKEFRIRVSDEHGNYLLFIESPAPRARSAGDFYRCVGNSGDGFSEEVAKDRVVYSELTISSGAPVTLQNIWASQAGEQYQIEEVIPAGEAGQYTDQSVQTVKVTLDQTSANIRAVIRNDYVRGSNNLTILKRLAGSYADWAVGGDTQFRARVLAADGADQGKYLTFADQQFTGTSATGTYVTFSANSPVTLTGIPSGSYIVEEASAGARCTVTYSGLISENGREVVKLLGNGDSTQVAVTNTYAHDTGKLMIQKTLSGAPEDWGVNNDTLFAAKVYEENGQGRNLLYFAPVGKNTYRCVGSAAAVSEPGYENMTPDNIRLFDKLPFSGNEPAILENLWVGTKYFVEEEGGGGSYVTTGYKNNGMEFPRDGDTATGNLTVHVINTYRAGDNSLILEKRLTGSYHDWGVNESTAFTANVYDITDPGREEKLSFVQTEPGSYRYADGSGDAAQAVTEQVSFSVRKPAVITGLLPGRRYEVREAAGEAKPHYTVTYEGDQQVVLPVGVTHRVAAVNNYEPGKTALEIRKVLAGAANAWNVNENTVFRVLVKCREGDGSINYIRFPGGKSAQGSYHALGNNGSDLAPTPESSGEYDQYVVELTAGQPVTITGLWPGYEYAVEEIPADGAHTEYNHDGVVLNGDFLLLEDGKRGAVTVTNKYPDPDESLTIRKILDGNYTGWGADENTLYRAGVYDITSGGAVKLTFEETGGGIWRNQGGQTTVAGTDTVTFSPVQPAKIIGLLPNHKYQIREEESLHYITTYTANGDTGTSPVGIEVVLASGREDTVAVTNRYDTDAAALLLTKEISGNTGAWSATEYTDYTALVKCIDSQGRERYLRFSRDAAAVNGYMVSDHNGPAAKPVPGDLDYDQYLITFSVKEPAVIGGLWPGYHYAAEETEVQGATAGYRNQSLLLAPGQTGTITVTNYYHTPGTTALMLRKDVSANAADWGILREQIFYVRLKYADGPHEGEYVMFPEGKSADNTYHAADPGVPLLSGLPSELPSPAASGSPSPEVSEQPSPATSESPSPGVTEQPSAEASKPPVPGVTESPLPGVSEPLSPDVTEPPLPGVPDSPPPGVPEASGLDESEHPDDFGEGGNPSAMDDGEENAGAVPSEKPEGAGEAPQSDENGEAREAAESDEAGSSGNVSALTKTGSEKVSNALLWLSNMKTSNERSGLSGAITLSMVSESDEVPESAGSPAPSDLPVPSSIPEQEPAVEPTAAPGTNNDQEYAQTPEPAVSPDPGETGSPSVSLLPVTGTPLPRAGIPAGESVNGEDPRIRIELVAGRPVMITGLESGDYIVEEIDPGSASVEYSREHLTMRTGEVVSAVITNRYPLVPVPPVPGPGGDPPDGDDDEDSPPPGSETVFPSPSPSPPGEPVPKEQTPSPRPGDAKKIPRTGDDGSGGYWLLLLGCAVPAAKSIAMLRRKKRK